MMMKVKETWDLKEKHEPREKLELREKPEEKLELNYLEVAETHILKHSTASTSVSMESATWS